MGPRAAEYGGRRAVVGFPRMKPRGMVPWPWQLVNLATEGADWPPAVGAWAAHGRPAVEHGATRGAAASPTAGAIGASCLSCLGLLGVREPTPSVARGNIIITIAIGHSRKDSLELPLWVEVLPLGWGCWRSEVAAGATLRGFFYVADAADRGGRMAAIVVTAPSSSPTADCDYPPRGGAQGLDVTRPLTRAASFLWVMHGAAGPYIGASTLLRYSIVTWASTSRSRGRPPWAEVLALR